jgi:glycosyltransferase involved in cell wall biosynthesis
MDRILQAVDGMNIGGGIQSFIMNVYRNIDRANIQFDFLLHRHNEHSYEEEIKRMGGRIYYVAGRKDGILKNKQKLDAFFKEHKEYKVVHFHCSSLSYIEPLIAAYNNGVESRVVHSHSSRIIGKNRSIHIINHWINKRRIHRIATDYLACGELAAAWMYKGSKITNQVVIITNGIDTRRFQYSKIKRNKIRNDLGIGDELLLCHVGRFEIVKNHVFLLNIFKALLDSGKRAKLMLVGGGTLFDNIVQLSKQLNVYSDILFLGIRNDVDELYQAADVVLLPSLYEGFPMAAIEAQASGVTFIMSDSITKEVLIKENALCCSISSSPKDWVEAIVNNVKRCEDNSAIVERRLDVQATLNNLIKIYNR